MPTGKQNPKYGKLDLNEKILAFVVAIMHLYNYKYAIPKLHNQ
jgi:hypothetical protein